MNGNMLVSIDFEYNQSNEIHMGLISCALKIEGQPTKSYWLFNEKEKRSLIDFLKAHNNGYTYVGYNNQMAEARCFVALGLDPRDFTWRDLMLEWKWLRNGDDRYSYGRTMKNGFPVITVPPVARVGKKASIEEEEEAAEENRYYLEGLAHEFGIENKSSLGMFEVPQSLLDCLYFFEIIDHKEYNIALLEQTTIRDNLIVGGVRSVLELKKKEILEYNQGDVAVLTELAHKITKEMRKVYTEPHQIVFAGEIVYSDEGSVALPPLPTLQTDMGHWAAQLAVYSSRGIPLSEKRLRRLIEITPELQHQAILDWNADNPENRLYRLGHPTRILQIRKSPLKQSPYINPVWTKDENLLQAMVQKHIDKTGVVDYPTTKTGKLDTSKKVLERYAGGEGVLKEYLRHQGHLVAIRAFAPNAKGEVEALQWVGSDFRQRPNYSPYGTQTSRNAAKAKSYIFLGSHWLRTLCEPEEGMAIIECDFSAQEVFIAAKTSNDINMQNAYLSDDVYMYYAQLTGMYPKDLPIPTEEQRSEEWFKPYKLVRNISKVLNLSMQFGAGYRSVVALIRDATNDPSISDEQGQEWVGQYHDTYPDYTAVYDELKANYQGRNMPASGIMLTDGWRMGANNPSPLSAGNVPVQGTGSVILREACKLADKAGLNVIATLHDAITLYEKEDFAEKAAQILTNCMKEAAKKVLGSEGMKVGNADIVRHGDIWVTEKAQRAWQRYSKYFEGL